MRKQSGGILFFTFFVLISVYSASQAQSLLRQTVSSSGNATQSDGTLIQQTIGQPYNTTTLYNNEISFQPGFQQPVYSIVLLESDLTLKVFPNPTSDFVYFESPVIIDKVNLRLIDNLGQVLLNENLENFKNFQLDCGNFSTGLYFINVTAPASKTFSAKLIINR